MDLKFIHSEHFIIVAACIKECGENLWDDDAESVKEYVGDINGCYHYVMFENKDGINSERDMNLPVF